MELDIVKDINNKDRILILSDIDFIIDSLKLYFQNYDIVDLRNPSEALKLLREEHFDLMILDYIIDSVHIENIVPEIRSFNKNIYILLITEPKDLVSPLETIKKLDVQSYYERSESFDQLVLLVESALRSVHQLETIQEINEKLTKTNKLLEQSYLDSIEILKNTVEAKDIYTKGHSSRVAEYSKLIGEKLNLSSDEMHTLQVGSLFHDIGKIGISDSILLKDSPLTMDEYEKIKEHPIIGTHILSNANIFSDILPIVKYHHEYFDGSGYPDKLVGESIPLLARIVSVADAFDAMTSKRSYRDASTFEEAKEEIKRCAGSQFDPAIAKVFLNILNNDSEKIMQIHKDF